MNSVDYEGLVYLAPQFISSAGLSSEAPISRKQFEFFLRETTYFPETNRFLYLHDCEHLVSGIQACTNEIEQILGQFYLTLNTEILSLNPIERDGIFRVSSAVTTKLFSYLAFIFIRLHSLLDYSVKVAFEAEHLKQDFARYPKLSCRHLQYGNRKCLSINNQLGTLFETCDFMTTIETLRNRVIHDGPLDDHPSAYEHFKGGVAVERFILFPDMTNGRLDQFVNRNLFFGREDKINLRLPALVLEIQDRLISTLDSILETLQPRNRN